MAGEKSVRLSILGDNLDAKAKLDEIDAKADDLAHLHPELKIGIDTAAAQAKLAILREELKSTENVGLASKTNTWLQDLEKNIPVVGSLLSGLSSVATTATNKVAGIFGSTSEGPGGIAGTAASVAGIVGLVAALSTELDGLVSGFAAAGVGAGAFGLLAMPAFKSISAAQQQITADQQAYDRALTKTAKNDALKHLKADYAALDPVQRDVIIGIHNLSSEFDKAAKAFEPTAFNVFDAALQVPFNLLPKITPFATSFANAIIPLLGRLTNFTGSKGFDDWLNKFRSLEGPAVTAIGLGIGKVGVQLGGLLTIMSKKDVVNSINIAFSVLAGVIRGLDLAVEGSMIVWDKWWRLTMLEVRGVVIAATAMDHATKSVFHNVSSYFDESRANVHRWYSDVVNDGGRVVSWFGQLPGRVGHALGSLAGDLVRIGENAMLGLLHGLERVGGDVLSYVGHLAGSIISKFGSVLGIHSPSTVFMEHGKNIVQGLALGIADNAHLATAAAANLARGVMPSGSVHAGAAGGYGGANGTQIEVNFTADGDSALISALKHAVRIRGGNPGVFGR